MKCSNAEVAASASKALHGRWFAGECQAFLLHTIFRLCTGNEKNGTLVCLNCFAILRRVIGLKNSRHFLSQSEVKLKPMATCSHMFSRALCRPHVFASSFDWFTGLFVSFVIAQSDYFGFGFTTLN